MQKKYKKILLIGNSQGVTLLEIIVGIALVSFVTLSLYMALFNATRLMGDSKQRIGAIALVNEQMEIIRNLEYSDVGTEEWIPSGPIPQTEIVERNGFTYTINTSIEYIDDPFDGQGEDDDLENDYKQAWIEINWMSGEHLRSVLFTSKFVPDGLESGIGGGILSINVIDGIGTQIAGATVQVDSVDENPPIHGSSETDATGNVRLPGMPQQEYKITVSKSTHETAETYPNPPVSPFTPIDSNVNVIEDDIVLKTITIEKSADLVFKAVDIADGADIADVDLDILGGRIIGTDPETHIIDQTATTDSDGEVDLDDIGPGTYDITNLATLETDDYQYIESDTEIPVVLSSEDVLEVNLMFAEKTVNSLLVKVIDDTTLQPVNSAGVYVTGTGFDQTIITSTNGLAFFPVGEEPPIIMSVQEYHVEIQTPGYQDYSADVDVDQLTIFEARLIL